MAIRSYILHELFEDVVRYVQIDCSAIFDSIQKPFFNCDTMLKFMSQMLEHDAAQVDKFPIIYLRPDYIENYNTNDSKILYYANCEVYIIYHTDPGYYIADRYEQVFKPILLPIYDSLIKRLIHTGNFAFKPTHSKQNLMYWGENNENFANDYIDAIHITNLNLGVFKTNCI
jgi:hypothetical protein